MDTQRENPLPPICTAGATPKTFKALLAAQRSAFTAAKDGNNSHGGYRYATGDNLVAIGRACFNGAGISVLHSHSFREAEPAPRQGKSWLEGYLDHEVYLVDEDGGAIVLRQTSAVICSARTALDKGIMASSTYALGYMMRDALMLDRAEGEANDVDQRNDDYHGGPSRRTITRPPAPLSPNHAKTRQLGENLRRWRELSKETIGVDPDWRGQLGQWFGSGFTDKPSEVEVDRALACLAIALPKLEAAAAELESDGDGDGDGEAAPESEETPADGYRDPGPPEGEGLEVEGDASA